MGLFNRKKTDQSTFGIPVGGPVEHWTGRALTLPFTPDVAGAPQIATFFAEGLEADGFEMDFSLHSLEVMDALFTRINKAGSDPIAEQVFMLGCYAGEVLVRGHGYTWTMIPDDVAAMFGFRLALADGEGSFANPLGKAFKLVENGEGDSLHFWAQVQIAARDHGLPADDDSVVLTEDEVLAEDDDVPDDEVLPADEVSEQSSNDVASDDEEPESDGSASQPPENK